MAKKKKTTKSSGEVPKNGSGPLSELKKIYQFMQDNNLQSVELDKKDFHVSLVRKSTPTIPVAVPVAAAAVALPAAAPAAHPAGIPPGCRTIKAPMMGIFYRAASPSSPPFSKEGDTIKKGDVICLIEAMKVFNDVKADFGGILKSVCVEDGKSIKVGQDLFVIEPQ